MKRKNIVLATGGGAVTREDVRKAMRHNGLVIYLHATLEMLVERTRSSKNRPLLNTGEDPRDVLEALMLERDPLYRAEADIVFENRLSFAPCGGTGYLQRDPETLATLNVELGDRSYPIIVGSGLLKDEALLAPYIVGEEVVVVTNETIAPLYLDQVTTSLKKSTSGLSSASRRGAVQEL